MLILLASAVELFSGVTVHAQNADRSYAYDLIDYTINVRTDSTFDVEEKQTYDFEGEYHQAERYIPFNKISDITDISVTDGETGQALVWSSRKLDKTNPSSWGKYTTYTSKGNKYIDWYYNFADTKHTWIIRYTIHGGIGFYKDHDEIYWNLFSDYDVEVNRVTGKVILPRNNYTMKDLTAQIYVNNPAIMIDGIIDDGGKYDFSLANIPPHAPVTIAVGWPKGLIPRSAYWEDFLKMYFPLLLSLLLIMVTIIILPVRWYFTEKYRTGRGTIIAEYEPPQSIHPGVMDVILHEGMSGKLWAGTVVDLAVRGYVKISDDTKTVLGIFKSKEYIVTKVKDYANDLHLMRYEKEFLDFIFSIPGETFSTRALKKASQSTKREMFKQTQELKDHLYKEIDETTGAYFVGLEKKKYLALVPIVLVVGIISLIATSVAHAPLLWRYGLLVGEIVLMYITLRSFITFNPRLNEEGATLKERILGFKLYLATAERYRLQNLTPDRFEKYLPYAMIFGVEKKWAKTFDNMNIPQPSWYVGAHVGGIDGVSSGLAGGFSTSAFSASFSSSFASAFTSASGGGASGGGGAGGGGGGGGGGAS